jgi:peroxiredoxin
MAEGTKIQFIPQVVFKLRELGEWKETLTQNLFQNKKVLVFALPGAFTPTCSNQQLPGYESLAEEFYKLGVDEIYCLSVNDAFVMNAWAEDQKLKNVKVLPDGSAIWTTYMGMDVKKDNLGFGVRSWRYAMLVNDMNIHEMFVEEGLKDNASEDPYNVSSPNHVLKWLKENGWGRNIEISLQDGAGVEEKLGPKK